MTEQIEDNETIEWSEFELIPEGLYNAEIVKIEKEDSPFEKGKVQLQIHFKIEHKNSQGENAVVRRMLSRTLNPKSKFFELVSAVNGESPSKEKYPNGITVSDLLGKSCKVVIKNRKSRNGNVYSRIDTFVQSEKKGEKEGQG